MEIKFLFFHEFPWLNIFIKPVTMTTFFSNLYRPTQEKTLDKKAPQKPHGLHPPPDLTPHPHLPPDPPELLPLLQKVKLHALLKTPLAPRPFIQRYHDNHALFTFINSHPLIATETIPTGDCFHPGHAHWGTPKGLHDNL